MNSRIQRNVGFTECGILTLAQSDTELEKHRAWASLGEDHGIKNKLLLGPEVTPHLTD